MVHTFDYAGRVPVIVGTPLLTLIITVTTAAIIAIIVSEFLNEEMKRQSCQRRTDNANLRTTTIGLAGTNLTSPATDKPWKKYRNGTPNRNITLTNTTVI